MVWCVGCEQFVRGLQQKAGTGDEAKPQLIQPYAHADQPFVKIIASSKPQMFKWNDAFDIATSIEMGDETVPIIRGHYGFPPQA